MEYQFRKEYASGHLTISMSMGHEAFATWLEQEGQSVNWVHALMEQIESVKARVCQEVKLAGSEFTLYISDDEVKVLSNNLLVEQQSLELLAEEQMAFYDQELQAECGLEDFSLFIASWLEFIE